MKICAAILLVIVSITSAEPPYQQRGFRPSRPFDLPLRSQKQQQLPPAPAASYGPPSDVYGPPTTTDDSSASTTTETVETTTNLEAETLKAGPKSEKLNDATPKVNPAAIYVVLPQGQNVLYAIQPQQQQQTAKLVFQTNAAVEQPQQQQQQPLVPIQAVPAFAKIQEAPQVAQYVEYQAPIAVVPVPSSGYTSVVNTPFSSSFVQSFQ